MLTKQLSPMHPETAWLIVFGIAAFMILSVYHSIKQTALLEDIRNQLVEQSAVKQVL